MSFGTKSSTCSLVQGQSQGDKQLNTFLFSISFSTLKLCSFVFTPTIKQRKTEITLERMVSAEMNICHQTDITTATCDSLYWSEWHNRSIQYAHLQSYRH